MRNAGCVLPTLDHPEREGQARRKRAAGGSGGSGATVTQSSLGTSAGDARLVTASDSAERTGAAVSPRSAAPGCSPSDTALLGVAERGVERAKAGVGADAPGGSCASNAEVISPRRRLWEAKSPGNPASAAARCIDHAGLFPSDRSPRPLLIAGSRHERAHADDRTRACCWRQARNALPYSIDRTVCARVRGGFGWRNTVLARRP